MKENKKQGRKVHQSLTWKEMLVQALKLISLMFVSRDNNKLPTKIPKKCKMGEKSANK